MKDYEKYYGNKIKSAIFNKVEDFISIEFNDGLKLRIEDYGQSCCESRYMTTDDDVSWLDGKVLIGIEIKDAPDMDGDECHEVQFLEIVTDQGSIQFVNHNEHNGYYGGFSLAIKEINNANT